jgi:hypothetical protein
MKFRYVILLSVIFPALLACSLVSEGQRKNEPQVTLSGGTSPTETASIPTGEAQTGSDQTTPFVVDTTGVPSSGHPRLWLTAGDIPRLRAWAVPANPAYADGLAILAENATAEMDAGNLPNGDEGGITWEQYPNEMYAELFAFMSLVENDASARADYAQRAHTLLMYVMNEAVQGPADGQPFRDPGFSIYDRSRWWGEGFPLTVDWIYDTLSTQDKTTIHQVFLRWSEENLNANVTAFNHPEPIGLVNDPVLVSDTLRLRWAANNYYMAHMRQIGLMSMALDPADDPNGELGAYLENATGAWLYVVDHLLRTEASGGLSAEGWQYGPESLGYTSHFLLALHTAGLDDPAMWGPQVVWSDNPFWDAVIPAYLHSLSPRSESGSSWLEEVYRPAWYGDGQEYWAPDFIGVFGPLGLYDFYTHNLSRLNDARWALINTSPGGASRLLDRVSGAEVFRDAILYFMLLDPEASAPADPHARLPTQFLAPGFGRLLARTGWDENASMLSYLIGWINIDHQLAEGNQFGFYRDGEWLTKSRTGWDGASEPWGCNIGRSDYHNGLALENDPPDLDPSDFLYNCYLHGSEYMYTNDGDGVMVGHSFGNGFVFVTGDSTNLYNAAELSSADILHASRSLVWLEPDVMVIYDRATSANDGRYKRFWLNLPDTPTIHGNLAAASTITGQQLFVTTLLPTNAVLTAEAMEPFPDEVAVDETMQARLKVEAPGGPSNVRFLNVLQGADAGATPQDVTLITGNETSFEGVVVNATAVLFPVDLDSPFNGLVYTVPASVSQHLITGLEPNGRYDVVIETVSSDVQITIMPGGNYQADEGGVLVVGDSLSTQTIYLPLLQQSN